MVKQSTAATWSQWHPSRYPFSFPCMVARCLELHHTYIRMIFVFEWCDLAAPQSRDNASMLTRLRY